MGKQVFWLCDACGCDCTNRYYRLNIAQIVSVGGVRHVYELIHPETEDALILCQDCFHRLSPILETLMQGKIDWIDVSDDDYDAI